MRGFIRRTSVADSLGWLDAGLVPPAAEDVPVEEAAGRVLAEDVESRVNVPGFARAMMDGLAVRAEDTAGASPYNRRPLAVVGDARPGQAWTGRLLPAQAVRIMTGSPMPAGADAVLPAELAEIHADWAWAHGEVSPQRNVGLTGEDVAAGSRVLDAGRVLRPQDAGVLASIGVGRVPVVRRPRVAVIVSGNELLPAGSQPEGFRIVDSNGPMLAALVRRDGGIACRWPIVPDDPEALLAALRQPADVLLVCGGTSVGLEDYAPQLIARHGELAVHGIAMRPSSPTGLGRFDGRLVILLPGNPVSCLCAYDFFAGRAIRALGGRARDWPYPRRHVPLARKIASAVGRVDYVRVRLVDGQLEPLAIGGASALSSTVRADGFVIVPQDSEGYPPGAVVEMFGYDVLGPDGS